MEEVYIIELKGAKLFYLVDYHPKTFHGQANPNHDENSELLLAFKDGSPSGISFYTESAIKMISYIAKNYHVDGIVIVPSHNEFEYSRGLVRIIDEACRVTGLEDLHKSLRRVYSIGKISSGGNRSIDQHIRSINVIDKDVINKDIIVFDDVVTSGNSMHACEDKLLSAGASSVLFASLCHTKHYY